MRESTHVEVAVIGAGPAGLAAAYRLRDECEVVLFERRNRAGGRTVTDVRDGYRIDLGAHVLRADGGLVDRLVTELELGEEVVDPGPRCRKRFLVRDGRLCPRPRSLRDLMRTPLLSTRAKLRLLVEPFVSPGLTSARESLASFVRRRLGPEVVEYGAEPVAAGMFGGAPDRLELARVFPRLYEAVREHGSLAGAAIETMIRSWGNGEVEADPEQAPSEELPRIFTFRGGTGTLVDALAARLEGRIRLGHAVRDLERAAGGYRFVTETREGSETWTADRVVVAVPACRLADLIRETGGAAERVAAVPHPPLAVLALGYARAQVDHPLDGFGLLVPRKEPFDLTGVLFSSRLDPDRAPRGSVLLTCYLGGVRAPGLLDLDERQLLGRVRSDLATLLGVTGEPGFVHHHRWHAAIPQYEPGHDRVVRAADRIESAHPGLELAGNYRSGISVADALGSGWEAAQRVLTRIPELAV